MTNRPSGEMLNLKYINGFGGGLTAAIVLQVQLPKA
jgi:hypothetical protein